MAAGADGFFTDGLTPLRTGPRSAQGVSFEALTVRSRAAVPQTTVAVHRARDVGRAARSGKPAVCSDETSGSTADMDSNEESHPSRTVETRMDRNDKELIAPKHPTGQKLPHRMPRHEKLTGHTGELIKTEPQDQVRPVQALLEMGLHEHPQRET